MLRSRELKRLKSGGVTGSGVAAFGARCEERRGVAGAPGATEPARERAGVPGREGVGAARRIGGAIDQPNNAANAAAWLS